MRSIDGRVQHKYISAPEPLRNRGFFLRKERPHLSCLFNSFDPYFKQPFGAVRAGQTVRLSLCIPEELGYVDPHLVLKKEGKFDVPVYYRMNFDGQTPRQNHFFCGSASE